MVKNIAIYNRQSFGDIMLSTNLGRMFKEKDSNLDITLVVKNTLNLTTSKDGALDECLDIFALQYGIDRVCISDDFSCKLVRGKPIGFSSFDASYIINGWYSDIGFAASQVIPYYKYFNIPIDRCIKTKYNVGYKKNLSKRLTVAIPGKLDLYRKWNNKEEVDRFLKLILNEKDIDVLMLGRDCLSGSYLSSLQLLNQCHLYIGPIGSMSHIAVGLGLDTINICSVFPAQYDSPEFYATSGYHKSLKTISCDNYNCITQKTYDENDNSWGNPPTLYNFWLDKCEYSKNGISCVSNISATTVMSKFYEYRNSKI